METSISSSEEHHVRTSPLPENAPVSTGRAPLSPSTLFDLLTNSDVGGLYGKTLPAYSVPITEEISQDFYPSSPGVKLESPNKGLEHPDLFALLDPTVTEFRGECWTLNLPEHPDFRSPFPNADGVCSLSDVLETGPVPPKYYLNREACLGLLRRASKRGKDLPIVLKIVLEQQAQSGCAQVVTGGGKGALIGDEISQTLQCGNDQTIVSVSAFPINSMIIGKKVKMTDRQTLGIGDDGDPLPTIGAKHHHAVCLCSHWDGDCYPHPTLTAIDRGVGASNQDLFSQRGSYLVCDISGVVRKLIPMECERLMGFPDNWTRIPWNGKTEDQCPDGPRYKACGNSMCVNVMEWIGRRIQMAEDGDFDA